MTKELEALKQVKNFLGYNYCSVDLPNELKLIEQALQRLEAIDNAKPSEALKNLDKVNNYLNDVYDYKEIKEEVRKDIETIKQVLLKSQEQEKVLEILKEKNVNIGLINVLGSVEQYNQTYVYDNMRNVKWCLTEEEFELVKRYCK